MRLVFLILALCCASAPARADLISTAILTTIGIQATATAVALTTFALTTAASIGLSYLSAALKGKPDTSFAVGGTTGKLQVGGILPRSFVVGTSAADVSLAYHNTFGQAGGTPNAYYVQVLPLSDLPVTGLVGLFVDGVECTYDPNATPGTEGIPIPEFRQNGQDYLWIRFYDGTQTTADARLVSLFGSDPDRPYGADRIGKGIAYAVMTARVNNDLFSGFPQYKFVPNGIKLYDRRADSSVGGDGEQRLSDPSTWAFSANNVVIVENLLRGVKYEDQWIYGAQTVTTAQLPFDSWTAAASECDIAIDLAEGGTEPQFEAGGTIQLNKQPADVIEEVLKGCNGKIAEIGGRYKIRVGAAGAAVFSFTDADILTTDKQTFDPFPSLGKIVNAVTAKYVSPADGWNEKDAAPLYDASLEAADGGRRQSVDIEYGFVHSGTQVQRLMRAERNDQRAWRAHALPLGPEAFVLEPLDVASWTSARNGYTTKSFDIRQVDDLPNLNQALGIKELDPSAYNWNPAEHEIPVVSSPAVVVRPAPQAIIGPTFEGVLIAGTSGTKRAAVHITWDATVDDVKGVQVEIRNADTLVVVLRHTQLESFDAAEMFLSQNILPSQDYEGRIKYVPDSDRETVWSDWFDFTTPAALIGIPDIDAALRDYLTRYLGEQDTKIDFIAQRIASNAADQDAANALDRRNVRTLVEYLNGNVSASITETAQIANTIDGKIAAAYFLTLDVNGNISGVVAYNDGAESQFTIVADVFRVSAPGQTGGQPVPVFAIADVGGQPKIVFRGDMYADGSITADKLNVNTLTAITGNFGNATVQGLLTSPNDKMVIDLTNGSIKGYA
jgi:hypothetical protein